MLTSLRVPCSQSHRRQFANNRLNALFLFTPLSKLWVSYPAHEIAFHSCRRVEFSMVKSSLLMLYVSTSTRMCFKESTSIKPHTYTYMYICVFCLCRSYHKKVFLLAFTLFSLSLIGLMLTLWHLESLPELGVSKYALYLENTEYWLVICLAQLTCKQSEESAFQYFCMMWMADPGKKQRLEGEEGFAVWCLWEEAGGLPTT